MTNKYTLPVNISFIELMQAYNTGCTYIIDNADNSALYTTKLNVINTINFADLATNVATEESIYTVNQSQYNTNHSNYNIQKVRVDTSSNDTYVINAAAISNLYLVNTQQKQKIDSLTSFFNNSYIVEFNYFKNVVNSTPQSQNAILSAIKTQYDASLTTINTALTDYAANVASLAGYNSYLTTSQENYNNLHTLSFNNSQNAISLYGSYVILQNDYVKYTNSITTMQTNSNLISTYKTNITVNKDVIIPAYDDYDYRIESLKSGESGLFARVSNAEEDLNLVQSRLPEIKTNINEDEKSNQDIFNKLAIANQTDIILQSQYAQNVIDANSLLFQVNALNANIQILNENISNTPKITHQSLTNRTNRTLTINVVVSSLGNESNVNLLLFYKLQTESIFTEFSSTPITAVGEYSLVLDGLIKATVYDIYVEARGVNNPIMHTDSTTITRHTTRNDLILDADNFFNFNGPVDTSYSSAINSEHITVTNGTINNGLIYASSGCTAETVEIAQTPISDPNFLAAQPIIQFAANNRYLPIQYNSEALRSAPTYTGFNSAYLNFCSTTAVQIAINSKIIISAGGINSMHTVNGVSSSLQFVKVSLGNNSGARFVEIINFNGTKFGFIACSDTAACMVYTIVDGIWKTFQTIGTLAQPYGLTVNVHNSKLYLILKTLSTVQFFVLSYNGSYFYQLYYPNTATCLGGGRISSLVVGNRLVISSVGMSSAWFHVIVLNNGVVETSIGWAIDAQGNAEDTKIYPLDASRVYVLLATPNHSRVYRYIVNIIPGSVERSLVNFANVPGGAADFIRKFIVGGNEYYAVTCWSNGGTYIYNSSFNLVTSIGSGIYTEGIDVLEYGSYAIIFSVSYGARRVYITAFNGTTITGQGSKDFNGSPYSGLKFYRYNGQLYFAITLIDRTYFEVYKINEVNLPSLNAAAIFEPAYNFYTVTSATPALPANVSSATMCILAPRTEFSGHLELGATSYADAIPSDINIVNNNVTIIYTKQTINARYVSMRIHLNNLDVLNSIQSSLYV